MSKKSKSILFLIALLLLDQVFLYFFTHNTNGLLNANYPTDGSVVYAGKTGGNAGSEDDIFLWLGCLIFIPLFPSLSIGLYKETFLRGSLMGGAVVLVLQLILLLGMEVGSVFDTVVYGRNLPLLLLSLNYFAKWILGMRMWRELVLAPEGN